MNKYIISLILYMEDLDIIRKFCKKKDPKILDKLSKESKQQVINVAKLYKKIPRMDEDTSLIILKHFKAPSKSLSKSVEREKAEKILNRMDLSVTGIRVGDTAIGVSKASKKATIKIHEEDVGPYEKDLDALRQFPDLWEMFLNKLSMFEYFSNMTRTEKELYLALREVQQDIAIGESKERLEIIQFGDSDFNRKLDDESREILLSNPNLTAEEIYQYFPRKPGSRARRHTLILLKSFWQLVSDYIYSDNFNGLVFDLMTGEARENSDDTRPGPEKTMVLDFGKKKIGIINIRPFLPLKGNLQGMNPYAVNFVLLLSAGGLKSLLQKIIRFRSDLIDLGFEGNPPLAGRPFGENPLLIPTSEFLLITMIALAENPGSLVPDIQRFVSGLESFCKRLTIIAAEDSFITDVNIFTSLLLGGSIAQRTRSWAPSGELFKQWLDFGISLLNSTKAIEYDINNGLKLKPYILRTENTLLQNSSAIRDDMKSFKGDLALLRDIASKWPKVKTVEKNERNEKKERKSSKIIMPVWHCVDQHWATAVAYFYKSVEGFPELFTKLFNKVTGFNPRREGKFNEDDPVSRADHKGDPLC